MALAHLTDLFDRAKGRLMLQYRALVTRFIPDLGVLVAESQELEDAFWAMFEQLNLDTAEGVWLDRLGWIVGQLRLPGVSDDRMRNLTKAKILANKSHGTSDELIAIANQAFAEFGLTIELVDWYPAAQALTLLDPPLSGADDPVKQITLLIGAARAVAVQTMFLWQDDEDAEIFVCGDAGGGSPTGKGFDDAAAPDDPTAGRLAGALNV